MSKDTKKGLANYVLLALLGLIVSYAVILGGGIYLDKRLASYMQEETAEPVVPEALSNLPFDVEVIGSFKTDMKGIYGWAIKAEVGDNVVYSTADGKRLFIGGILDENGENITEKHLIEHIFQGNAALSMDGQPEAVSNELLRQRKELIKASQMEGLSIPAKNSDGKVYLAVDLNCPYCQQLVEEVLEQVAVLDKQAEVNIVPLCLLGEQSCIAHSHFATNAPADRLEQMKKWFAGEHGYDPQVAWPISAEEEPAMVQRGNDFMMAAHQANRAGVEGVPYMTWEGRDKEVYHIVGVPSKEQITAILEH